MRMRRLLPPSSDASSAAGADGFQVENQFATMASIIATDFCPFEFEISSRISL